VKSVLTRTALTVTIGIAAASVAAASDILVTTNISTSTTWTANNTYNLQQQIYVLPGATLTIEAGTVVASTTNIGGSLAVCRGAQIFVNGTQAHPVIMTSTADVATWVSGNPKTGTWRPAANEWGNLTVMGNGFISENAIPGNVSAPNANNVGAMEGLVAAFPGDPNVLYGGGNDDDDSGTIAYLSLRYGGKVIGLNNELNGLSLGGIGRGTDIHHIDIMNNVDDGIEIWGGTVNLKYVNIWNIGDDSFDIDQGWRGKAQFGLIVQGYSVSAAQGSGVGDNCFETDGAEDSDWQPVTTSTIYNFTVIGQPVSGDQGTAWRDNARIQYRNCVFMDLGEDLVKLDNTDGDGAHGYGFNGTLSWAATWTTPYNMVPVTPNDPASPSTFYPVQTSGYLAEITDSVFFRNLFASAYTTATTVGVLNPSTNNVLTPGSNEADSPVKSLVRGAPVTLGSLTMLPVQTLDPRPANAALTSINMAPNDGFFTPAQYRGGFQPGDGQSWLCDWTASFAFGFTPASNPGVPYCFGDGTGTACPCGNNSALGAQEGCLHSLGQAGKLTASGCAFISDDTVVLNGSQMPNSSVLYFQGTTQVNAGAGAAFGDGKRCAGGSVVRLLTKTNVGGASVYPGVGEQAVSVKGQILSPGTRNYQAWFRNAAAFCTSSTFNLTNGVQIVWGP
jgi:hypothetical protein